uniref:Putative basic-leucine zipper transcription factor d n=1 Tax=Anopheles darlingi TaxID=43151 RepID=A0A2M4D1H2_ANODA
MGGGAEALLLSLPSPPSLSQSLSFAPTSSVAAAAAAAVAAAPSDCFCGSGTNTDGSVSTVSSFSMSSSQRSFCDCHVVAASDVMDVGGRKISLPYGGASGVQSSKAQAIGGGSRAAADSGNSIQKSSIAGSGLREHSRSAGTSRTIGLLAGQDSKGGNSSGTIGITSRITVASGLLMCRRSPKAGGSTGNSGSSSSGVTCKQFRCEYCQFSCSWPYDLKLHLKQKHGIHKKSL